MWSTAQELLDHHRHIELLTLDFFDTLVTRNVAQPTHVFAEVERFLVQEHGPRWRGYGVQRVRAEQRARKRALEDDKYRDVTLDEIVQELAPGMKLSLAETEIARTTECATEIDCARPVPLGMELFTEARTRGIALMVVSDNYMPASHLVEMAHRAGFTSLAQSEVLVSCEHGGLKHNGRLWREVLDLSGVAPRKILHVGDDVAADVTQPTRLGIATYRDPRMRVTHRHMENTSPDVLPLSRLEATIRDETYSTGWDSAHSMGAGALAVLIGAQLHDVRTVLTQREVAGVYFAARDGWLAHQVWSQTLAHTTQVSGKYLAFSRSVYGRANLTVVDEAAALRFVDQHEHLTIAQLGARFDCTLVTAHSPDTVVDADTARQILLDNEQQILRASHALRDRVLGYLGSIGMLAPGHHVVVDAGWTGATVADLAELVGRATHGRSTLEGRFLGLYWDATTHRTRVAMHGVAMDDMGALDDNVRLLGVIRLWETLMTAPHGSVIDFLDADGEFAPVFAHTTTELSQHGDIVGKICMAAVESAVDIVKGVHRSGVTLDDITGGAAWAAMMQVGHTPRRDELEVLSGLRHVASVDHIDKGTLIVAHAPRHSSPLPPERYGAIYDATIKRHWMQGSLRTWARQRDAVGFVQEIYDNWSFMNHRWVEERNDY
jgi:FMN phosphatase YigB (HAD superfamily)